MNQSKWRNFVVGAMLHEGVRQDGNEYTVSISDLTFDLLKDTFPTKYQNPFEGEVLNDQELAHLLSNKING